MEETRKRHWQEIKDEGPEAVDLKIVDLYAQRPERRDTGLDLDDDKEKQAKGFEQYAKLLEKWDLQLGEGMGQIPSAKGRPRPGPDRFSCSGFAIQAALLIRFNAMVFVRPAEGAPAVVDWLRNRRCVDFKYDFHTGGDMLGDDLD